MAPLPEPVSQATVSLPADGKNVEGHDGVCFTAGPKAAVVGAGTIHAYLASRRRPPRLVAGISLGALNAAAMQRVYRDMQDARDQKPREQDASRWRWFRRYLDALCNSPFSVIWKAIPDQSDFFADMIPIRDASVPPQFSKDEVEARRQLYLKVKLGRWLSHLPVTVRLVSSGLVNYVRMLEKYPPHQRFWSLCGLIANGAWLGFLVTLRVGISPQFFSEHVFRHEIEVQEGRESPWWTAWIGWLNLYVATAAAVFALAFGLMATIANPNEDFRQTLASFGWAVLTVALVALAGLIATGLRRYVVEKALSAGLLGALDRVANLGLKGVAWIYTFSNIILVGVIMFLAGVAIVHSLTDRSIEVTSGEVVIGLIILWSLGASLLPFVVIPQARRWLVRHKFLAEWPRPLFGWGLFVGSWLNLTALTATLVLGAYLIATAPTHADSSFHTAVSIAASSLLVVAIPAAPQLPVAFTSLLWPHLRRYTRARRGWRRRVAWIASAVVGLVLAYAARYMFLGLLDLFEYTIWHHRPAANHAIDQLWSAFDISALILMGTWFFFVILLTQPVLRRWFIDRIMARVGLQHGLIPDLPLRQVLHSLFERAPSRAGAAAPPELVSEGPGYPTAVIVACPLQMLRQPGKEQSADQFWAKVGTPLQRALRTALASPPLLAPVRLAAAGPDRYDWWLSAAVMSDEGNAKQLRRGVDLVDGSVIRHNPLPAVFGFLRSRPELARDMAGNNDRAHAALHVVYGVPTEGSQAVSGAAGIANTIVDVGLASLRLSQRRDTQLEVMQTNVIAGLESLISEGEQSGTFALFADEIAPAKDVVFANQLSPRSDEVMNGIAAGCRRSMERLYADELRGYAGPKTTDGLIDCRSLLRAIGKIGDGSGTPGLPEVCGRCSKGLAAPVGAGSSSATISHFLGDAKTFAEEHPHLSGEQPRIVLIASGGVFRGAFHIGLLAALREAGVKPDLIVGASVGTLMGGAFGAMVCRPDSQALAEITDIFINVDERVALTQTLKNAARELGIRGRAINLSPWGVRRMVRRGASRDPGFASTGAPSPLIDALSDLFLIPHRKTQRVASDFVAGDVTGAVKRLLNHFRTETIRRLEIQRAVLGTSLLEGVADRLLVSGNTTDRASRQPFHSSGISFFGTTTNLHTQSAVLLGGADTHQGAPYDFVEAALASSAFPAVFAPRSESHVFPGSGNPDVLFADGGMFDNLPFLPAIEVLSVAQSGYCQRDGTGKTRDRLLRRLARPDLLIVGALDPLPENNETAPRVWDSIALVQERAGSLKKNVKLRSFELAARRVDSQLRRLAECDVDALDPARREFADKLVNAAVMAVYPHSRDHLNGTFSFCASTGLSVARVQRSIADGCFQTMRQFVRQQSTSGAADLDTNPSRLTARSLKALRESGRVASMASSEERAGEHDECPFFTRDGKRFRCPFTDTAALPTKLARQMRGVFIQCREDWCHR